MEYTLEHLNLDLRKASLYAENAIAAFNITIDETAVCESAAESDIIITEAEEGLGIKVKMAIKKIVDSIKKFFTSLIEKIKGIFNKKNEDSVKKAISGNPAVGKVKIDVTNIKEIESYCGKRYLLRAKLVKKCKAGTLTQDEFDKIVADHDALGDKMKKVGIISVSVAAAAGLIFGGVKLVSKIAGKGKDAMADAKGSNNVKTAELVAQGESQDAQAEASAKTNIFKKIVSAIKSIPKKISGINDKLKYTHSLQKAVKARDNMLKKTNMDDVPDPLEYSKLNADEYYDNASAIDDFDLTDTFFDI